MSDVPEKKQLRRTLLFAPWLLAFLLAAGWGLSSWTPGYLETLVPKLARDMGLPLTEFNIRRAGLFSADIGPIRLGSEKEGLRLSNVRVEYTPASLKLGRVNSVILDGMRLQIEYGEQGLRIPLLQSLNITSGSGENGQQIPPLPFDNIEIRNSLLDCRIHETPLSVPFTASITPDGNSLSFSTILRPRDQQVQASGSYAFSSEKLALKLKAGAFRLGAWTDLLPVPLTGRVDLDLAVHMQISSPEAVAGTMTVTLAEPDFSAAGIPLQTDITLRAAVADQKADFTVSAAGMDIAGTTSFQRQGKAWNIDLQAESAAPVAMSTGKSTVEATGLQCGLSGTISSTLSEFLVQVRAAGLSLDREYRTGPVNLTLPLAWPPPEKGTPGTLSMAGIRINEYALGTVTAGLRQQGAGLDINGSISSNLLPGLRIPFKGAADAVKQSARLKFSTSYALPDTYDPARLLPALSGYTLGGTMDLDGSMSSTPEGVTSQATLFLSEGSIAKRESGLSISGIRLIFEMPDLLDLRSAPAQLFAFETLTAGSIEVSNGRAAFQLEPQGVILVEGGGFDWAGGSVTSRAFRVVPGRQEYDVSLFCNELMLSEILRQLGLAQAKGEAALSGELPVTWKDGRISFKGGFLHSTPGQGGSIQVEGLQSLMESIPEGTPQRGQLELAQAAVKDFEYKWVRIKADTVGKDLLLRLSLDGKPAGTLPFVYRKEIGGFMQVEGDVQGSNFQGLRLDVNFSLPLDRILLYNELIKMIE